MEPENKLAVYLKDSKLPEFKSKIIREQFDGYFDLAEKWEAKALELTVTDASQATEMKMAREARLMLRQKRLDVERVRKELKEDALREGKMIDGVAKMLTGLIEPIEDYLDKQERFVEIQAEEVYRVLRADRERQLSKYNTDTSVYDLGKMTQAQFEALIEMQEVLIANAKRAEDERIAKEKRDAEEYARVSAENARLKAEAEEKERLREKERIQAETVRLAREAEIKRERDEADAKLAKERKIADEKAKKLKAEQELKLKAEREEKERVMAELKAKQDADDRAKREAQAIADAQEKARVNAERKAKAAPDKAKLLAFATSLESLARPDVSSPEAKKICADIEASLIKFIVFIKKASEAL